MSWIGRSLPRLEDPALVQGAGNYVADVARGAASVRFVRSPVASGTILNIEKPLEGIVFTAADLVGVKGIKPILHRPDYVPVEQPILAKDRVVFAGQAIAVVVADHHAAAEDIAEQVFVDIEPDDPALDVDLALIDGAPVVHEQAPGNVLVEGKVRTPGLDEVLKGAQATIKMEIRSRRQAAMPLATRGGVAQYERVTGRVKLFASV
jgi:carbon-monoxide dehydrogenase large subunit